MKEPYEPSQLEIWRQCSDIQATWTRDEEQKRRGFIEQWRPPGCERALRIGTSSRSVHQRGVRENSLS
jgi:hypothetical protein